MTEKRFTYIKNSSISQYQSIPIQEIGKGKAFHCQGLVDKLNKLFDENEQLLKENKELKDLLKSMADRNNEIWLDDGQIIRLKKVFKEE